MSGTACTVSDCKYTIRAGTDPAVVVQLLQMHQHDAHTRPMSIKAEKVSRPKVTAAGSSEDWEYFSSRWSEYKKATNLTDTDCVVQLLECCDESLRRWMFSKSPTVRFVRTLCVNCSHSVRQMPMKRALNPRGLGGGLSLNHQDQHLARAIGTDEFIQQPDRRRRANRLCSASCGAMVRRNESHGVLTKHAFPWEPTAWLMAFSARHQSMKTNDGDFRHTSQNKPVRIGYRAVHRTFHKAWTVLQLCVLHVKYSARSGGLYATRKPIRTVSSSTTVSDVLTGSILPESGCRHACFQFRVDQPPDMFERKK